MPSRCCRSLAALAALTMVMASVMACSASAQTTPAPPAPPAAQQPMGPKRPLSQIPPAKLATLRQLADMVFSYDKVRQSFAASRSSRDNSMRTALQQKGLGADRAQQFIAAFEQQFGARLATAVNNDLLVQMLDASYTDDQATQLLAFYKTPLGQRVAEVGPVLIEVSASQLQQTLNRVATAVGHDVSGSFPELNQDTAATPAGELPRPTAVDTSLYPPVGQAQADLAAAEKRAAAHGHRVLVIFGANWCYDCHVLDSALHSPAYQVLLAGYETVNVNVGDSGQDNLDLVKKLGADISKGVPALAVLDAQGNVLVAQKQGEFQDTRALKSAALTTFLQAWTKR